MLPPQEHFSRSIISTRLIQRLRESTTTTPLRIATDCESINANIDGDPIAVYCRSIRILEVIQTASSLQRRTATQSSSLSQPVQILGIDELLHYYREQLYRWRNLDKLLLDYLATICHLEAAIQSFLDHVYPIISKEDYLIFFEGQNPGIATAVDFNDLTIAFNNLIFGREVGRANPEEYVALNEANPYLHLYAVADFECTIIGALEVYPLTRDFLHTFERSNDFDEALKRDGISDEAFRTFDETGSFSIFVDTIATHGSARGKYGVYKQMLRRYLDFLIERVTDGQRWISHIYGEGWTDDGRKMARMFGMTAVRDTASGTLYKINILTERPKISSLLLPDNFTTFLDLNTRARDLNLPQVFLSYSHHDRIISTAIVGELEECGLAVVQDVTAIKTGQSIRRFMREAVTMSSVVICIVSRNSLLSGWVAIEFDEADREGLIRGGRFIPCVVDGALDDPELTTTLLDAIDERIRVIRKEMESRIELQRSANDMHDRYSAALLHRQLVPQMINFCRDTLCADLRPETFEAQIPRLLSAVLSHSRRL